MSERKSGGAGGEHDFKLDRERGPFKDISLQNSVGASARRYENSA
jgi:hypothetical protein